MQDFEKWIGCNASVALRRPGGNVFFVSGTVESVSPTHLFLKTRQGTQAIGLSEIARAELHGREKP